MNNTDYLWPAVAAATLAILFPIYWIGHFSLHHDQIVEAVWADIQQLNASDALFVLIGVLTIYVYFSLMRILNDHFNYRSLNVVLWIMITVNAGFMSTLLVDIAASMMSAETLIASKDTLLTAALAVSTSAMVLFGVLDILLGVVLLRSSLALPAVLKVFAAITLIQGLFELTVVLSFMVLLIFPLALIVLATYFLREPDAVELV